MPEPYPNWKREKEGPWLPDRSFETTDWADDPNVWPLLILEYVDGGLDSIYGPYTNTADIMAAYRHLTQGLYDPETGETDDGYQYELQPLKGRV